MNSYAHLARLYDGFMNGVDCEAWASYVSRLYRYACGSDGRSAEGGERAPILLECGCGTGNITVRMKRMGYELIAADISDEMLAVASEKARLEGLRIPFVRMDMRNIAVHRRVDAVIACCDCVNYLTSLDDAERFFSSAYEALRADGVLIFDISSRYKLESILGCNAFTDSAKDAAYFWQNSFDPETKLIEMRLDFFTKTGVEKNGAALYARSCETHIQRAHEDGELVSALQRAGFSRIEVFDAFTFEPPKPDSERLQFLAVKQGA